MGANWAFLVFFHLQKIHSRKRIRNEGKEGPKTSKFSFSAYFVW